MIADNRVYFEDLRRRLLSGLVSYDDAKEESRERLSAMNETGKQIAKKHGKKFRPFTFSGMMR